MHILLLLIGFLAALLILGCVYQFAATQRDRRRSANSGRWIEIGDRQSLFVVEKGTGSTTVVFESGIAATHLNWCAIQNEVSRFACAVAYDRCGLGWSSPARTERTPVNAARELHRMLEVAGIHPPYVLVGHSFGGMVMRQFALLHPDEVAGVVLVDPMRCCEWPPINAERQATLNRAIRYLRCAVPLAHVGLARLAVTSALCGSGILARRMASTAGDGGRHVLGRVTGELAKMPAEILPSIAAHWSRPEFYKGMRRHIQAVPETVREMCNADAIERIPVLVLTPEQSTPLSDEEINSIGSNAKQLVTAESGHWVHLDRPDLVIQSIFEMVMVHDPQVVS
jgi:pimeloyl-ACP methyl ester carboxylesterase